MSETRAVIADKPLADDEIELTEAEREAMNEDDGDEGEGNEEGEDETDLTPAPEAEDPAPPAGDAPQEPVTVPLIRSEDTEAATTRLAAIDTESNDLAGRFDDGDITAKEYAEALKKLESERRDLDWTIRKTALAAEMIEQQQTQAWFGAVNDFLAEHPEIKGNKLRYASFDMAVREVTGNEANAALTGPQKLAKAYKEWSTALNIKPAGKPETPKPEARKPLPPSLANIPASDASSVEDGKYALLDRLAEKDPMRFEAELARMSEAEQDAYSMAR